MSTHPHASPDGTPAERRCPRGRPRSTARPNAASKFAAPAAALSLALSLAACGTPPSAPAGGPAPGGSAAQAHARLVDAFNTCNEAAFVGAFAPLFTFVTSNTRQPVTTREGLQRYLGAGCASRPNPTATLLQQSTRVSGAITVLVGQYRFKVPMAPAAGGAPASPGGAAPSAAVPTAEVPQNFTLVLERMGERWLVLAHHVSVAP